jgi:hypothetical protein
LVRSPQSISIADIALVDDKGVRVLLRDVAPAVILLDETCPCDAFVAATFDAVTTARPAVTPTSPGTVGASARSNRPPSDHVSILVVGTTVPRVPSLSTPAVPVTGLSDPNHSVRLAIPALMPPSLGSDILAAAVLIDGSGAIVRVVPAVRSAQDFRNDVKLLW